LYTQNAKKLETELTEIHTWIKSQIATIPASNRKLVTTHDAMGYYAAAYGIPVEGALQGISTEEKPTANRIQQLVNEVKASTVPTLFAEVVVNPKLIEAVAKEANVNISDQQLYSDSLGEPGSTGDTYPEMLIANTKAIVEGLKGRYTAFQPN
jgi:manganese/iron transport system substrate-binding protein